MKKSLPYLIVAVVAVCIILPAAAEQSPQKPGKWQTKMEVEIPGMPIKMPPVNITVCLTEEDVNDPDKALPKDPKSDCKVGDYKIDGDKVSWTVDCPKQNMKGTGELTFTDESYSGWMKMLVGEQEMKTKYSGKWLGECTK